MKQERYLPLDLEMLASCNATTESYFQWWLIHHRSHILVINYVGSFHPLIFDYLFLLSVMQFMHETLTFIALDSQKDGENPMFKERIVRLGTSRSPHV